MMGKLQASTMSTPDAKDVIISGTEKHCGCEPPDIKVVRINTHGPETTALELDQAISSKSSVYDKRRSVRLERTKLTSSWGFTLQSYGIYNSTKRCIENYTYVDYVELKTPAYLAGMKRGDIIFAVDGQSTGNLSHEELVERIKSCKSAMRMVLVNSRICQKVELHQRRQKLQALLRQKQSELLGLEKRETAIYIKAKARSQEREMETCAGASEAPAPENHYCSTLLVTENNNTVETKLSPDEKSQRDVRPKLSPVNPSIDPRLSAECRARLCETTPSSKSPGKHSPRSHKTSKSGGKHGSPTCSKTSKQRTQALLTPNPGAKEGKLRTCMSKLALSDEPTAYERIVFGQSRQTTPPDNLALRPLADSSMFRSVRLPKSPPAVDPLYRSMRLNKNSDSKGPQDDIRVD